MTEVVLVSGKHEPGFEYPLNLRFSTNSNPYVIRSDWQGPIGKYTLSRLLARPTTSN